MVQKLEIFEYADEPSRRNRFRANATKILKNKFPIATWLPRYTFAIFLQDLLAGFTVTLTEVPQGIAYALVAGLPTEYGLYAGIMGGCLYFFFGGCKDINIGPTAILALLVQKHVTAMGPDGAVLITFLSGLLISLAGILHLGFLVEFFSFPIISGFTTAAAINIACTQLKSLLGISGKSSNFLEAWESVFKHIGETRKWDSILGFASIVCLFALREIRVLGSLKYRPDWTRRRNIIGKCVFFLSLAGNALAVITGTTIAYVAETRYNSTPFILTGAVKAGFPPFGVIPFETTCNGTYFNFVDMLSEYGMSIIFCPMIAFLEHVAIVKAFSKGKIIDATQELIALGICNLGGSLVRSMPATGSFTRTAVNNASGVKTTTAGLLTSLMLLLCIGLLTGLFQYIPKATLAAVIIVAMYYLCEFHAFIALWKTKKLDLIPFLITLLCCLLISLEIGILIGIGTNMLFVLYDSARPDLHIAKTNLNGRGFYLVKPKVGLHFTSAEYFRQKILSECEDAKTAVVIDGEYIKNVDATIARTFAHLLDDLTVRNQKLVFWNFNENVFEICTRDNKKLLPHFERETLENIFEAEPNVETTNIGALM
ncbi:sodium-independent sulfate anion transporter-like isoform X2 [Cylas formicarius]|uniref:sodium-independent sulfate anion transporter-like isoform X2 n=1 Tax=Cylas formicarius TaxID=197179 RepID=UPI0029586141|nr:sodium-independent sulfate anion transporter-like isoform X2 [Cylas formicarius]